MKGFFLLFSILMSSAFAAQFPLPAASDNLLGQTRYTSASSLDSPAMIAKRYGTGLNAIIAANPGATETALRNYDLIKIPTSFLLPPVTRTGIVVNLPEMRMYYYSPATHRLLTFPVGIGRVGLTIPIQRTIVTQKKINPTWTPTANIRKFNEEQGIDLPGQIPAGPDNPLGPYAIYLGIPSYLIHSTIYPESIGKRASFGCIRMREEDIKVFFPLVTKGTPVTIINVPTKMGWQHNHLFLESHPSLEEHALPDEENMDKTVQAMETIIPSSGLTLIDWPLVAGILEQPDGIPHSVGIRI